MRYLYGQNCTYWAIGHMWASGIPLKTFFTGLCLGHPHNNQHYKQRRQLMFQTNKRFLIAPASVFKGFLLFVLLCRTRFILIVRVMDCDNLLL
ncbi:hypothetical protein Patl1_27163 [Pistacia atlantica]|uniref:Uncharacterized protein n=1 Tax=Pistacia atlantica TaxID=434234 RepID=A0ACC1B3P7_9ROSI|nr:hypothetical protein Patl1_27163 [Pistacia atlantica]